MTLVHVVTSCTDRKRAPVARKFHLGSVRARSSLDRRVSEWTSRLETASARAPARNLYAGEHWTEFLALLNQRRDDDVEFRGWVISAGYGLIPVDALVAPYQATFARSRPDSVVPTGVTWTAEDWWASLSDWQGPAPSTPRTLVDLLDLGNDASIVIAASATYLRVLRSDLNAVPQDARHRVTLFSSANGVRGRSDAGMQIHYDSRVLGKLGGSRISLNIRVLAWALAVTRAGDQQSMRSAVQQLMRTLPPIKPHDRKRASDEEVSLFIRQRLEADTAGSATRLLRAWRSAGRACEQRRFKDLFNTVLEDTGHDVSHSSR